LKEKHSKKSRWKPDRLGVFDALRKKTKICIPSLLEKECCGTKELGTELKTIQGEGSKCSMGGVTLEKFFWGKEGV